MRPVRSDLADAMARVGAALDVRPVSGATEPSPEYGASGSLPPSDVLAGLGVGDAARGKAVPGRSSVRRRMAEVVPIEHVPAVRLRDGGEATVPDEGRESETDSMRVHQLDERDDLAVDRSRRGRAGMRPPGGDRRSRAALSAGEHYGQNGKRGAPSD